MLYTNIPGYKEIYNVYCAIYELSHVSTSKKNSILTALMGAHEWSWKVVGISVNAMEKCKSNGHGKTKGIQRAHIEARILTARKLFECNPKMSIKDFFAIFMANDKTVLVNATEGENKTTGELPDVIPFSLLNNNPEPLFKCLHIGYEHKQREADFLEKLHDIFIANGPSSLKPVRQL